MTVRRPAAALAGLALAAGLAFAPPPARAAGEAAGAPGSAEAADADQAARYRRLLEQAWGPETPERLETYLGIRERLKPLFEQYGDGIMQWALREASTRPVMVQAQFGVLQLRHALNAELERTGLHDDDYLRLTLLVYGRWLRSVRDEDPPEKNTLRALQEMEVGLSRRLANNPPEGAAERKKLQGRLASVSFQARYIAPFALLDKAATLARIDAATRGWLEAHRARIEALDFGPLDTAAPPRTRPEAPPRPAG